MLHLKQIIIYDLLCKYACYRGFVNLIRECHEENQSLGTYCQWNRAGAVDQIFTFCQSSSFTVCYSVKVDLELY